MTWLCGCNDNGTAVSRTAGAWLTITWHVSLIEEGIIDYTREILTAIQQTILEPVCNELIVYYLYS